MLKMNSYPTFSPFWLEARWVLQAVCKMAVTCVASSSRTEHLCGGCGGLSYVSVITVGCL